jgi:hypothetical protein
VLGIVPAGLYFVGVGKTSLMAFAGGTMGATLDILLELFEPRVTVIGLEM